MTPHFTVKEVACRCGCGLLPEKTFMNKVEMLRVLWGKPITVNRAASCAKHNVTVSTTGEDGPHVKRRAIDIDMPGDLCFKFLSMVFQLGMFTGIGVKQKGTSRMIHLDDLPNDIGQPRPRVWTY